MEYAIKMHILVVKLKTLAFEGVQTTRRCHLQKTNKTKILVQHFMSTLGSLSLQEIFQGFVTMMMAQVKSRGASFKPQLASADSLLTGRSVSEPVKHRHYVPLRQSFAFIENGVASVNHLMT